MRFNNLFGLSLESFRSDIPSRIMSSANITLGIAVLFFFTALGQGIKAHISRELTSSMPEERLVVKAGKLSVSVLRLKKPAFLGGSAFDDKAVDKIRNLKSEAGGSLVKAVHRELPASFPVSISGNLFGFEYGSDVAMVGVDPSLVESDISPDEFKYVPGKPLPVLVPQGILDMYNMSFALSNNLPELSEKAIVGRRFRMHPGVSSLTSSPLSRGKPMPPVWCYVAGLTKADTLMGISTPIEFVQKLNRVFDPDSKKAEYSRLYVDVSDGRYISAVKSAIKAMGYEVDAKSGSAERLMGYVSMGQMFFAMLAAVILLSSCMTIFNSYRMSLIKRTGEFGLYSCLGASRRDILAMILLEAVMLGIVSGLMGVLIGGGVAHVADWIALKHIPDFSFKPDSFFSIPLWLVVGSCLLAGALSVLSALPSAYRAYKLEPAIAVSLSG